MSLLKKAGIALLTAIVLALGGLYFLARQDLLGGKNYLKNATRATEKVELREEGEFGIKYIEAETFTGAIYGLGVAHARDRLWQMYFFRMIAKGRVSEVRIIASNWFGSLVAMIL